MDFKPHEQPVDMIYSPGERIVHLAQRAGHVTAFCVAFVPRMVVGLVDRHLPTQNK